MTHLARLLQLSSPALPVGGYSYSQGLEAAVEAGVVHDAPSAQTWIGDLLDEVMPRGELAVLARLLRALPHDTVTFDTWHCWFRVSRETRELRAETEQMGSAMLAWLRDVTVADANVLGIAGQRPTWPAAFAVAAHLDGLPHDDALTAYAFAWLENQVLAAIKLVPLGQAAGQRLLRALATRIPTGVQHACTIEDDDVSAFAPGLALLSSRHETQYSRLFRS
jgi:urease accessory protein